MNLGRIAASVAILLGSASLASAPAQAAYVMNIDSAGDDVVATGSGSINMGALSSFRLVYFESGFMITGSRYVALGSGPAVQSFNNSMSGPSFFGNVGYIRADISSGPAVGISVGTDIFTPYGYESGTELGTSRSIFRNLRLSDLGVAPGSYKWTWGSGDRADSFTINVGLAPSVPELATWATMIGGLGLVGASTRRRRRVAGLNLI